MFDTPSFVWLLLPLGIALGWVLSSRMRGVFGQDPTTASSTSWARSSTAKAAQAAAGSVVDEALDTLDRVGQADPDIYEIQMILGASLRTRGAVDRAIGVHERLVAAAVKALDDPDSEARAKAASRVDAARFELARDFVKAGLMDRAENLLEDLCRRGVMQSSALELLLSVHEQARAWEQADATARQLQSIAGKDFRPRRAHYFCEIAEQTLAEGDMDAAASHAHRALEIFSKSPRARLLVGDLAEKQGDLRAALRVWQRVPRQNPRFFPEVLPRLARVCQMLGETREYREYIDEAARDYPAAASVMLERARLIGAEGGDVAAYLVGKLAGNLHWSGLLAWVEAQCVSQPDATDLAALRDALRKHLEAMPSYRCTACGLTSNLLFWQCPGCKHWDTVAPDNDSA